MATYEEALERARNTLKAIRASMNEEAAEHEAGYLYNIFPELVVERKRLMDLKNWERVGKCIDDNELKSWLWDQKELLENRTQEYEAPMGTHITDAVKQAINLAKDIEKPIIFKFNNRSVIVNPNTTEQSIINRYLGAVPDSLKPTEAQMKALAAARDGNKYDSTLLGTLYDNLESLI